MEGKLGRSLSPPSLTLVFEMAMPHYEGDGGQWCEASCAIFVNVVQLLVFSCTPGLKLPQEYRISSTKTNIRAVIQSDD